MVPAISVAMSNLSQFDPICLKTLALVHVGSRFLTGVTGSLVGSSITANLQGGSHPTYPKIISFDHDMSSIRSE